MQAATSTSGFECPVCFERFNDSDHAPKSLSCGHSCCLKCAKNLFADHEEKTGDTINSAAHSGSITSPRFRSSGAVHTDSITCPICRSVTQTQPTSLPTNYGILNAMPPSSVFPTPPIIFHECSMCKKTKRPVVKHCETCNLFLCESHTVDHQDDHEDHVLKPTVQEVQSDMCPKHPKKELEGYCSDCSVCVCPSCCMFDHNGHKCIGIPAAFDKLKPSIESAISRSLVVCGEMNVMVDQLKNLERDLSGKESDIVTSIHESFNQIHAAVDAREAELLSSLPSKRLAVESQRQAIESQSNQLSSCSQSSQAHLESNDKIYCLSNADPLIALLSSLDDETKSNDWRQVKYDNNLQLTCDAANVVQSIEKLGELDVSNAILRFVWVSECRPIIDGVVGEMDQKLNELLCKQSSWVECDRELSSLVDLRFQSCLHQVESICGGDEMIMIVSKNELDEMIAKSRTRLRQGWEMIVTSEFDSALNHLLTQMMPVNVRSVDELGSHLLNLPQAMDGSLRVIGRQFGPDDDFVKTKMDSIMNQLMAQHGSIKRGFETLFGISGQMKQEVIGLCNEIERNLANMKWEDVDERLACIDINRRIGMQNNLNLAEDWFDVLIRSFQLELDGFVSEKRSGLQRVWDAGWRTRPCLNELDCRRVVVDVLKQTRGESKWNGPDDQGNRFNWSEELPLGRWDGIYGEKRIQVDGNGMITKLWLSKLKMRGLLPESIRCLTSLTELYVSNNQLTQLPDIIGNLTSLTHLGVYNNPITSTQAGQDEVKRRFGRAGLNLVVS